MYYIQISTVQSRPAKFATFPVFEAYGKNGRIIEFFRMVWALNIWIYLSNRAQMINYEYKLLELELFWPIW